MNNLNKEQSRAVTSGDGPLLILAGAGSGKTRVLTHRITYLINRGVSPGSILAITFTNKAAQEIKERVLAMADKDVNKIWMGTFHSVCLRILRANIKKLHKYKQNFTIFDEKDSMKVIKLCIEKCNKSLDAKLVSSLISGFKDDLLTPESARLSVDIQNIESICNIYNMYQEELIKNNAMDFDDIIFNTVNLLNDSKDIRDYYQNKFQHVLVDEYQDVNYSQYMLAKILADKYKSIFVVGDDFQSIYGWRGANIKMILNFESDYSDATVINLEQNYRSTKNIVDAGNQVIKNNKHQKEKNLWTDRGPGQPIYYRRLFSDLDESEWVVSNIRQLIRRKGYKFKDFAILYRANFQSRVLEDTMLKSRTPYEIVGNISFYERKEIKDILAYLKVIDNNNDEISLERIINEPKRGIGKTTLEKIKNHALANNIHLINALNNINEVDNISSKIKERISNFMSMLQCFKYNSIGELATSVLKESGYMSELTKNNQTQEKFDQAESRISNLNEFLSMCFQYDESNTDSNLNDFLHSISLFTDTDELNQDDDSVKLMTLHNAKGLEFPVVFIVGVEQGILPHSMNLGTFAKEEERRLFYVGITRAKDILHLSSTQTRLKFGARIDSGRESEFLYEIPNNLITPVQEG